ncbi:LysR family transcriptional regulator [Pigmentiphaga aceris]|uniref:LysR family transcriptional regulator n=1 Tax=Pigmentiphaga aceris TaxID=1940612 RepID=A0A5C0AVU3_9BURK|nr:LysR family transcriptional regulator [Pigmentiphaga aceris]QEI05483.1 LysR family transcriptional regulator [Pigmentiphaga aceris]
MNTRFVEAFLWVARLGSFRAAAERLHLTQAAISNRIASLEADIGARLFDRDPRGLRLTPVGQRMLDYGDRLLELRREIVALGKPQEELIGLVRIGAIESVVHTWLVGFLENLRSTYPGIEVQLTSETTQALHTRLREGSLDIALQTDQITESGIISTPCLPMPMGWVGAGDRQMPDPQGGISALLRQPVLTMSPGSQPHLALKQLYHDAGMPVGKVHCVSSIAAIVRLVRAGFGNALVPLPPVLDEIARGDLQVLPCATPLPPQRIVVSHIERGDSAAIAPVAALACRESDRFIAALPASLDAGSIATILPPRNQ